MTERASLLQAVLDDPADDQVRLVYADWLEEYGDERDRERAAFIRKGLARPLAGKLIAVDARGRVAVKVAARVGWAGPTAADVPRRYATDGSLLLRRGFVVNASLTWEAWREVGPSLVASHPVEKATLMGASPAVYHGGPGGVQYLRCDTEAGHRPLFSYGHWLPPELFDLLEGHDGKERSSRPDWPDKGYAYWETAQQAVSEALLRLARVGAGRKGVPSRTNRPG